MSLKPMLAETLDDATKLSYPVLASPKLDGIRCLIRNGTALSRSLKPIRNKHVQKWAALNADTLEGLDGELISGEHDADVFNRTTSVIMSGDGSNDWTFHAFDLWNCPDRPFDQRLGTVLNMCNNNTRCAFVNHVRITSKVKLDAFEQGCLDEGFEGVMVRKVGGGYKYGRSTLKEGLLLKVKQFRDDEALVIGVEEMMHNENEAKRDNLGRTERSTDKAGLVPAGCLGALVCRRPDGVEFRIGSGFTAAQRADLWRTSVGTGVAKPSPLVGKLVVYKHFPQGVKDAPRFPTFKGFRSTDDL